MDIFEAIADPTRRGMLDLLAGGDRAAGELVAAFPALSQPAVSRHLRVLREVGLVDVHVEAQHRVYKLTPEHLAEIDSWIDRYREFWDEKITALEQHLVRTQTARKRKDS